MKLFELKRGSYFKIDDIQTTKVPVAAPLPEDGKVYWFGHIDGMYSYCKDGEEVVHFAAWTDVEEVNQDGSRIQSS